MKIMVVDQHTLFTENVINLIKGQPDIEIVGNASSDMVEEAFTYKPDVILMGASLFEDGGKEIMSIILSEYPDIAFIILAPNENPELLLSAIRSGAKGYLHRGILEIALLKSLYAVERGEVAVSRTMISEIATELHRMSAKAITSENEKLNTLTYRELEVLRLLAAEASNHEIGRELFISNNTVRVHVHNILEKLKTKNRREAAKFAQRLSMSTSGSQPIHRERERFIREK